MDEAQIDISFVIPTLAQTGLFLKCVHSLIGACLFRSPRSYEIIVVDDGSPRADREKMARDCLAMGCQAVFRAGNEGFTRAVNEGMRRARGRYITLVNDDIRFFQPQWLELMLRTASASPERGITGCRLLYPNGLIQHGGMGYCDSGNYLLFHKYVGEPRDFPPAAVDSRVIAVTGAVMMINRRLVEDIGYLDETFRLTCSDTDYCLRAQQRGWAVYYCGQAEAIHFEGKTRGNLPENKDPYWYRMELQDEKNFRLRWQKAIIPLVKRLG